MDTTPSAPEPASAGTTVDVMSIIGYIVLGLIMGALAKAILPGRQGGGWISTLIVGVVGAILGGVIGNALFHVGLTGFFSIRTWILALVGSLIVLVVWGLITKNRGAARA